MTMNRHDGPLCHTVNLLSSTYLRFSHKEDRQLTSGPSLGRPDLRANQDQPHSTLR
jgi:hypothetical protein